MSKKRWMVVAIGMAAAVLVSGCATTGYQKAEKSSLSMGNTKAEVENAYGQVTLAINALDKLMGAQVGDLRPLYESFAAEVKRLQSAAESARSRAQSMKARNEDYFATWAQEIDNILDPAIKSQSLQRYKAAKASYLKVEQSLFKTGDAYKPLISSLTDIQTAISQDLTPSGINAVRSPYTQARQKAIDLQKVMKDSTALIDAASKQLTTSASGAAP